MIISNDKKYSNELELHFEVIAKLVQYCINNKYFESTSYLYFEGEVNTIISNKLYNVLKCVLPYYRTWYVVVVLVLWYCSTSTSMLGGYLISPLKIYNLPVN